MSYPAHESDPDFIAASAAAAGVAALDLSDDVDLSVLPSVSDEVERELSRLAAARRRNASPARGSAAAAKKKAAEPLNLDSADAFPSLGGGPGVGSGTASASAAAPKSLFASWANKTTLASGSVAARTATAASNKPAEHQSMVSVRLATIKPAMISKTGPNADLTRELKYIQTKTKTVIGMSKKTGTPTIDFKVRGPVASDVEIAKRMIVSKLTPETTATLSIPARLRGQVIGSQGKVIQGIQMRTQVTIDFERPSAEDAGKIAAAKAAVDIDVDTAARVAGSPVSGADLGDADDQDLFEDATAEPMVTVTLTGDAQGISMAKDELIGIVGTHVATKRATLSASSVNPSLYAFLIGPKGTTVAALEAKYDVKIAIPPPAYLTTEGRKAAAGPHAAKVVITGDEAAVRAAAAAIKARAAELEESITELSVDVDKRKHKFVLGTNGANVATLLATHGCVVELPHAHDPSAKVLVRGPADKIGDAISKVMQLTMSVVAADFSLAPYVAGGNKSHTAAAVYAKYLNARERAAVQAIEEATNLQVYFPRATVAATGAEAAANAHSLELAGPSKAALESARTALVQLLTNKGTFHYATIPVAQEMLKHPKVKSAIVKARGPLAAAGKPEPLTLDTVYLAGTEFADELVLVVFDVNHKPTAASGKHQQQQQQDGGNSPAPAALAAAAESICKAAHQAAEFGTRTVTVPTKYHRYIVGPKGTVLNAAVAELSHTPEVPLVVRLGSGGAKTTAADKQPVDLANEEILVRGILSEVTALVAHLNKIVEEAKHAEIMGTYEHSFTIASRVVGLLVGKAHVNMQKYKDLIGINKLDIGAPQGDKVTVALRGTKQAVEAVEQAIRARVAEIEDTTTQSVSIPSEFHRKLIGEKGKYAKRLEENHSVKITFPRGEENNVDPNAIIVKGPKKGVAAAISELVELYKYEQSMSYTDSITIPSTLVSSLVGRGGANITQLKTMTGTKVDLPPASTRARSATPTSTSSAGSEKPTTEKVTITGSKEEVELTKAVIREFAATMAASGLLWPSEAVSVPTALHRRLIGPNGSAMRAFVAKFHDKSKKVPYSSTASEEVQSLARTIFSVGGSAPHVLEAGQRVDLRFPPPGSDKVIIRAATAEVLAEAKAALLESVAQMEDETTVCVQLPIAVFPSLIGRGGTGVQELQTQFGVQVNFARKSRDTDEPVPVPADRPDLAAGEGVTVGSIYIRGPAVAAASCAEALFARSPASKQVDVPASKKRAFLINGASGLGKVRATGVQVDTPKNSDGDEVWHLRGTPNQVTAAAAVIEQILATAEAAVEAANAAGASANGGGKARGGKKGKDMPAQAKVVRQLTDIEQRHHKYIIGRAGQTITDIRAATSTAIDVPKAGGSAHAVTVSGATEDDVEEAERMIREAIARGTERE
ncbi:hypothetical protein BC828DRAFT_377791 [Blastocladiella britannica]|nr:hypothetical protein BC828DRAFT_377791 [Blastocladiella britannica]